MTIYLPQSGFLLKSIHLFRLEVTGSGELVGGSGVLVVGSGVLVGGSGVLVGGSGVQVAGMGEQEFAWGVKVADGVPVEEGDGSWAFLQALIALCLSQDF